MTLDGEPLVTVVIVPRERFHMARESLDDLLEKTDYPHELVYVDGNSPGAVRRHIRRRAREHGFRVVRTSRYLSPNEARNLGRREVGTRYVVFIDNDTLVQRGWLRALVDCAEETDAAIVGPLCLNGPLEAEIIHAAGGEAHIREEDGRRVFVDTHGHAGHLASEVRDQLVRQETELCEFHCMLVRSSALDEVGPLDEGLLCLFEHSDLCMLVRERGGSVWLEPTSVMTYVPPPPLGLSDARFFMLRWSEEWARRTVDHFQAKWDLAPDDPGLTSTINFCSYQRRLLLDGPRRVYRRTLGAGPKWLTNGVVRPLERVVRRSVVRWSGRA